MTPDPIESAKQALREAIQQREDIRKSRGHIAADAMNNQINELTRKCNALLIAYGTDE